MAHARLAHVRERYSYRCGYCGVSETDVGGELTVDHFRPLSAGGGDDDDNLVYACVRCNQYKGTLQTGMKGRASERRFLHPILDDIAAHVIEDQLSGRLEGTSPAGAYQIEALRLNRPALIANRQRRNLLTLMEARLRAALDEITLLRERITRRDLYIRYLEERLRDAHE